MWCQPRGVTQRMFNVWVATCACRSAGCAAERQPFDAETSARFKAPAPTARSVVANMWFVATADRLNFERIYRAQTPGNRPYLLRVVMDVDPGGELAAQRILNDIASQTG